MGESTKNRIGARIVGIVTAANRHNPDAWRALAECDMVEFRADLWDSAKITEEVRSFRLECTRKFGKPLETIFTLRLQRDGGAWPDAAAVEREKIWLALGLDGEEVPCDWIDLEMEHLASLTPAMRTLIALKKVKVLASHHNLESSYTKEHLKRFGQEMLASDADGIKLAVHCRTRAELLDLVHFGRKLAQSKRPACVLSMGSVGQASRLLGPLLGCPLTYGYLSGGAIAPGQFSVSQMRSFFTKVEMPMLTNLSDSELLDWVEARMSGELLAN